jgi:lipopolysaccharide export system permease protein
MPARHLPGRQRPRNALDGSSLFCLSLCLTTVYRLDSMRAITRYVFGQLSTATIAITVALTFAIWMTQSLRLIDFVVNRGLPATAFLTFVALLLPSFLAIVLPIAAFCAVLFVYHKLTMDSELIVLRAAGLSSIQLARPALLVALIATVVVYSITLYFLPVSYRAFKELQFQLRSDYSTVLLQEGAFNTVAEGITVYVRERSSDGELRGILVHDTRNPDNPVSMMAERGAIVRGEAGPRVVMINGNRQQLEGESGRLSLLYFDSYTVDLTQLQSTSQTRWRNVQERFLPELLNPDPSLGDERYRAELAAEGHQRLVAPLYTLTFILVGLAALLTGEFNRRGQNRRVLIAVTCVAVLEGISLAMQDFASTASWAIPGMYAAPLLPMLIAFTMLVRHPRRRIAANAPELVAS